MKKAFSLLFVSAILFTLLNGCDSTSLFSSSGGNQTATTVPVSLTMTDDPPAGVTVLFFQVSLTAASLTTTSGTPVSLISNPIQVDVTQLQALSAFLSTASVPPGSYSGLNLTFASPQLVILNTSDQAIASTCAVGSVCQLTPALDNSATVNLTSSPFPVTVAANSPLGFLIDFRLNTIIQSDLSVNLGAANGVTLKQLPPVTASQPPQFGSVTGTIESINSDKTQFTIQTLWGKTYTIDTDSNTVLTDWPPCVSPGGLACLAAGDVVQVRVASVESGGDLLAASIRWLLTMGQQKVTGTIFGFATCPSSVTNAQACVNLILHDNPTNNSSMPIGGMATVAIASGAAFSIDSNGFTIPAGLPFAGITNLAFGQTVQVNVVAGSLLEAQSNAVTQSGWGPPPKISFTTNTIQLEPSQVSGSVSNISSPDFTLGVFSSFFHGPAASTVQTTTQTTYRGFTTDSFSGLADSDLVSVNGWIIEQDNGMIDPAIAPPFVLAETVTLHSDSLF